MSGVQRFGNYFLLQKIATGGMAELYKAKKSGEKGFEKLLAIKMILPHLAASDEFISMFIDEAKVAALLNHQNIVQIYDLGRIEDSYCIVMEYVRGKDLRTVISRAIKTRTPIKMEHACLITAGTLAGLGYAHRKRDKGKDLGIVHRDISPQNILISHEGEVKIVDFGIAKAATQSRDTQAGVLKGKLSYMSPEQAMGKPLDMRSDVFSTGVVLYELLTGRKLFQGDTDIATLEMVRAAKVEPLPTKLSRSFPPALEAILLKALAKNPDDRYQSAADMETALLEFMRSAGYSTSGYSLSEYMHRLFKEEIEQEARQEQEIDQTVVDGAYTADTVGGSDSSTKVAGGKAPAKTPAKARVKTAGLPPRKPAGREEAAKGRGGLFIAVLLVVAVALGGVWAASKMIKKRRAARQAASVAVAVPETAPVPESPPEPETAPDPEPEPAPSAQEPEPATGPDSAPVPESAPEQEPAPEPEAAPEPADASISSRPAGAKVYLDGDYAGDTPVRLSGIQPDEPHRLTLKLDGYNDWTDSFSAGPGEDASINAEMKEMVFSVDVSSMPPGARLLLDGSDTGRTTPSKLEALKPGRPYAVRLELEGYEPYEETVRSDGPGTLRLAKELVRQYGELAINTRPWAFVFVDGEKKGMTPLAGIRLGAGEHALVLHNPKLELKKKMKVLIKPDETTRIVIDLGNKRR